VSEFIHANAKDFIHFKIDLLLKETGHDPIKRVAVLKDFIESISLIPDRLTRLAYVKESANQMQMDETAILGELNKLLRRKLTQKAGVTEEEATIIEPLPEEFAPEQHEAFDKLDTEWQEKEIIRQMLLFGEETISVEFPDETGKLVMVEMKVANLIISDLRNDNISFSNPLYQKIFDAGFQTLEESKDLDYRKLTNHPDPQLTQAVIDLIATKYSFSPNWERKKIRLAQEHEVLDRHIPRCILSFKVKRVRQIMKEIEDKIKAADSVEEQLELMAHFRNVQQVANLIDNGKLGRTII
jgi:DNA primase